MTSMDEYVKRVASEAPPLSDHQRSRLRLILSAAREQQEKAESDASISTPIDVRIQL